jgi:KDO2-lipid IV(A) lauroyltransferase
MLKLWSLKLAHHLLGWLPLPLGYLLATRVGEAAYFVSPRSRAVVQDNLRQVLGDAVPPARLRHLTLQAFRNSARGYFDLLHLPWLDPYQVARKFRVFGLEEVRELRKDGRGMVLTTAHMGTPDLLAQMGKVLELPITVLVEPMEPPEVMEFFLRLRRSQGISYAPVTSNGLKAVIQSLKQGGVVVVASDRAIQGHGEVLPFFGTSTLLPTGAVELAMKTGSALVPAYGVRTKQGFDLYFEKPIWVGGQRNGDNKEALKYGMEQVVASMERLILQHPEQWLVFTPIWNVAGQRAVR